MTALNAVKEEELRSDDFWRGYSPTQPTSKLPELSPILCGALENFLNRSKGQVHSNPFGFYVYLGAEEYLGEGSQK